MDPHHRRQHDVMLAVGYVLIGLAILMLTIILLFVAYGFGYKNGQVIQNGLLFVSSQPNPAQIYINGVRYGNDTNTRIALPAGTYNFKLQRSGYRDWQRAIVVQGGQVTHFDYPLLFPTTIKTTTIQGYASAPTFATQSPDRRWLVVTQPGTLESFDVYDSRNPKNPPVVIKLPAGLLSAATSQQSLQLVSWSDDNSHILIKHSYGADTEYILLNRPTPDQSLNLSRTLTLAATGIDLRLSNKKFDQYLVLDTAKQALTRASLNTPQLTPYAAKVLAYQSYGDNTLLYATPDPINPARVNIALNDSSTTHTIRHVAANTTYLLDLTQYNGDLYVAVSASGENVEYVYKNPASQIANAQLGVAVPVRTFRIAGPTYLAFSTTAQYILFENGTNFAVYDAENELGYSYVMPDQLDAPQVHAAWMDGAHLDYTSSGKLEVFDYDGLNRQTLVPSAPQYSPYFDQSYNFLYTLMPSTADKTHELLTSTSLVVP